MRSPPALRGVVAALLAASAIALVADAAAGAASPEPLILYASTDPPAVEGEGYTWEVVQPDGTGRLIIGQAAEAFWSPDGTRIYLRDDRECRNRLLSVRPDGTDLRLELEMRIGDGAIQLSPEGSRMLFVRYQGEVDCQLPSVGNWVPHVSRLDGSAPYSLHGGKTAWAPDGGSIVVGEDATTATPARLKIVDLGGVTRRSIDLPDEVENVREVSWGRGGMIAFVWAPPPGPTSLAVAVVASEIVMPLTPPEHDVLDFAWSPDGSELAYVDSGQLPWRSWAVDVSTGARQLLTPADSEDHGVAWSSDGRRLVITRTLPGKDVPWIVLADSDGGGAVPLVPGQNPAWQPHGILPDGALERGGSALSVAGVMLLAASAVLLFASQREERRRVTPA